MSEQINQVVDLTRAETPTPVVVDLTKEDKGARSEERAPELSAGPVQTQAGGQRNPNTNLAAVDLTGDQVTPAQLRRSRTVPGAPGRDGIHGQATNWCFTVHVKPFSEKADTDEEPVGEDLRFAMADAQAEVRRIGRQAKWLIAGLERAPTTGALHWQCAVIFPTRVKGSTLKNRFHVSIHWEVMKYSPGENYRYCTKTRPEDPVPNEETMEMGTRPEDSEGFNGPGKRVKCIWDETKRLAKLGKWDEISSEHLLRYYSGIQKVHNHFAPMPAPVDEICGEWHYGVSGSGKTHHALMNHENVYYKQFNKWWDGYQGNDVVVMDDMGPDHAWMIHHLKQWTDRFPFPGETKGGMMKARPKKFIITSNHSMEKLFKVCDPDDVIALKRRFKVFYYPFKYGKPDWKCSLMDNAYQPEGEPGVLMEHANRAAPGPDAAQGRVPRRGWLFNGGPIPNFDEESDEEAIEATQPLD
jgi:hypothetical protein